MGKGWRRPTFLSGFRENYHYRGCPGLRGFRRPGISAAGPFRRAKLDGFFAAAGKLRNYRFSRKWWSKLEVWQGVAAMASPNGVITKDPDVLGGTPVFRGTRVPFQALLDYLEAGQSLNDFLDDFPTVTREAAVQSLEHAKSLVVSEL
jgi:uncharacterized protein (DUF433 family)